MYRKISSPSRAESVAQMIESIFALFISFFTIANWSFVPGSTFSGMFSGSIGSVVIDHF